MRPDRFVSENLLCYWERGSESMLCLAGEVGFPGVWNGDRVFCQGNEVSYFRHCKFENIYRDSKKKIRQASRSSFLSYYPRLGKSPFFIT